MVGKISVSVEGLKELDEAMGELTKAAAKGVAIRALTKAAEPMRAQAAANAPRRKGGLSRSIVVSAKAKSSGDPGAAAFAAARAAGGSKSDAVSAMRDARRAAGSGDTLATVYVGPVSAGKRNNIKAMVQEFGSVKQAPQPYLRPAFESTKQQVVDGLAGELRKEIDKAAARAARKAAKAAAKAGK